MASSHRLPRSFNFSSYKDAQPGKVLYRKEKRKSVKKLFYGRTVRCCQTSLIRTPKGQIQVSALERCRYYGVVRKERLTVPPIHNVSKAETHIIVIRLDD